MAGLFLTLPALAQSPRATAYLLTNAGDTLRGALEITRFPTEYGVRLKVGDGAGQPFQLADTKGFGTADGRCYQRRRVSFAPQQALVAQPGQLGGQDSTTVFLQELIAGKVHLYRLDYHLQADRLPMAYSEYVNEFYYVQAPGSRLVMLQQATYQQVLAKLFQDCASSSQPAAPPVAFSGPALAKAVLRYNTTCAQGFAAPRVFTQRPPDAPSEVHFGLRAGVVLGKISYADSYYLDNKTFDYSPNLAVGLSLRISNHAQNSLTTGLYFTARRNTGSTAYLVPGGYTNQGETLTLSQQVAVNTLQVPLIAQLMLGKKTTGLLPFFSFGLVPGIAFSNTATIDVLTPVYAPGSFVGRQTAKSTNGLTGDSKTSGLLGLQGSVGLQPRIGTRTLLAELYYEIGKQLVGTSALDGKFTYQGAGLRIGIDF